MYYQGEEQMVKEKAEDDVEDECAWYHRIHGIFGDNESHSRRDWAIAYAVFMVLCVSIALYVNGAAYLLERIFGV